MNTGVSGGPIKEVRVRATHETEINGESKQGGRSMDAVTEERLEQDWKGVWPMIQGADTGNAQREALAPLDNIIERFRDTLSEDQRQVFKMLLDLRVEVDLEARVLAEDHYFQIGCLAGYGTLDQIRTLIAEYPEREAQAIAEVIAEDNVKKSIDKGEEPPEPGHLQLV